MYHYGCGRVSQIWTISPQALTVNPSHRVRELARHKTHPPRYVAQHVPQYEYGCGRSSAIWKIRHNTLTCPLRPRTMELAEPKQLHPEYQPNRSVSSDSHSH